jgi:hypothetical protein
VESIDLNSATKELTALPAAKRMFKRLLMGGRTKSKSDGEEANPF